MEWDEGGPATFPGNALQTQLHNITKATDPATSFRILGREGLGAANTKGAGMVSGRVRRIREILLPSFDEEL